MSKFTTTKIKPYAELIEDYSVEEIGEMALLEGRSPIVCKACGEELDELEVDLEGTEWPCPECGASGEHIVSVARLMGLA